MNVAQKGVFTLGLSAMCFVAAYQVASGQRKIGESGQRRADIGALHVEPTMVDNEGARLLGNCHGPWTGESCRGVLAGPLQ